MTVTVKHDEITTTTKPDGESIELFFKHLHDQGIHKRKDGSLYAVLAVEPTKDEIEEQSNEKYKQIYLRRTKLIDHLVTNYIGTNKTIYLLPNSEVMVSVFNGEPLGSGINTENFVAVFSNFRLIETNQDGYRRKIHSNCRILRKDFSGIIDNDSITINPAFLRDKDNNIVELNGFYLESKIIQE